MSEKMYNCDTGFLVTQDNEGNYLPFLLRVRSNEIIWPGNSANNNPRFTDALLEVLRSLGVTTIEQINPCPTYHVRVQDWDMRITDMNHVVYTMEIPIEDLKQYMESIFVTDEVTIGNIRSGNGDNDNMDVGLTDKIVIEPERRYYDAYINLPLSLKRKGLHVTTTLNVREYQYKGSVVNTTMDATNAISRVGLSLIITKMPEMYGPDADVNHGDDGAIFRNCEVLSSNSIYIDDLGRDYEDATESSYTRTELVDVEGDGEYALVVEVIEKEVVEEATTIFIRVEGDLYNSIYDIPVEPNLLDI